MPGRPRRPYTEPNSVLFLATATVSTTSSSSFSSVTNFFSSSYFSAIVKLHEHGSCSQNRLGRLTAMDVATIKGVIDRLTRRGITETSPDPDDARLLMVSLTAAGRRLAEQAVPCAARITEATLAPLSTAEQARLLALLDKLR